VGARIRGNVDGKPLRHVCAVNRSPVVELESEKSPNDAPTLEPGCLGQPTDISTRRSFKASLGPDREYNCSSDHNHHCAWFVACVPTPHDSFSVQGNVGGIGTTVGDDPEIA